MWKIVDIKYKKNLGRFKTQSEALKFLSDYAIERFVVPRFRVINESLDNEEKINYNKARTKGVKNGI